MYCTLVPQWIGVSDPRVSVLHRWPDPPAFLPCNAPVGAPAFSTFSFEKEKGGAKRKLSPQRLICAERPPPGRLVPHEPMSPDVPPILPLGSAFGVTSEVY